MAKIISKEAIKKRNHWVSQIGKLNGSFAGKSLKMESDLGSEINQLGTQTLLDHLRLSGNIPESYGHDTSEEKQYSKYTDSLLCFAYKKMGLKSIVITKRVDVADVEVFAWKQDFFCQASVFVEIVC